MIRFVDVEGLAGAWSLGTVQTGKFEMQARKSLTGGFGDMTADANRHLLGDGWDQQTGDPYTHWDSEEGVGFLCGTPPCSGFSLLNRSRGTNARGASSEINNCMKELVTYATRCTGADGQPGPEVVAFESVQGAFTAGRDLMLSFRDILGGRYAMHHVLMSGSTIGAPQFRHRYFPVFSRIPFGVDPPTPLRKVVTYEDAIGDLEGAWLQWEKQKYPGKAQSSFARSLRSKSGKFSNHVTADNERMINLIERVARAGWKGGDTLIDAIVAQGIRPKELEKQYDPTTGGYRGWNYPIRVRPERPGYVLTGSGIYGFIHYSENRLLTVAECSRLMGYPDDWVWATPREHHAGQASALIGKCCPVTSGRWISEWVARSLGGSPGAVGERIGRDEHYYNFTNLYKDWPGGRVPRRGYPDA